MSEPWAAPDAPAEEPPARVVAVPGPSARTGAPLQNGPPELPVPLRPLSAADRVDGALRILKLAPGPVVALTAAVIVPLHLVAALTLRDTAVDGAEARIAAVLGKPVVTVFVGDTGRETVIAALLVLLDGLAVAFVASGLGALVSGWYLAGERRGPAEVLALAGRRLPAVAAAWFLVHLAEAALGLFLVVPAAFPMVWFALVAPIIGAEGLGPWRAMRRSMALTRRAFGAVLGTCLLVALLDAVLRFALSAIGFLYVDFELPAAWAVSSAVTVAARMVTVPFVAGTAVLLYLDLRVRLEGLDIDLAADERFPRAP